MSASYISEAARLAYTDEGAGMPMVFLHPTPLDHDYWLPMIEELRTEQPKPVRAIVPDLRGHGESELGELPVGGFARVPDAPVLTMRQLAADVLALLDRLEIEKALFAGCSIGGYVLLELWRQAPERMQGLAFVCSKPQPDGEAALQKRAENIARVRAEGVDGFFDTMANTLIGSTSRTSLPWQVREIRARMKLTVDAVTAVQAGLATRPDSLATVGTIDVPVLSIAGREDSAVSPADMDAFRAAPGGCMARAIADAGHLAAYEQPGRVAEMFGDWMRRF